MGDEKERFALTLCTKKVVDENGQVYYKQDGERFDSHYTMKMTLDTKYNFSLMFRPPQVLDSVSVRNASVTVTEDEINPKSSSYHFDWSSNGISLTKSNQRDSLPIILNVHGLGSLTVLLQVKFYKANDKNHSTWGTALHHIDLECEHKHPNSFIDIIKEVYRLPTVYEKTVLELDPLVSGPKIYTFFEDPNARV